MKEFYADGPKYVALIVPSAGIADFSAVTAFDVLPDTLRALARSSPIMPNQSLPTYVVAPSPLIFGMARMFQLTGEETRPNLHVVRSLDEVFVALAVDAPKFQLLSLR